MAFLPPKSLVIAWHRLVRAVSSKRLSLFFSPGYQVALGGTPIDPNRGEFVLSYLFSRGLIGRKSVNAPHPASLGELERVHEASYLDDLRHAEALVPILGFEVSDEVHHLALEAQRLAVGGTIEAARAALDHRRLAVNLGGGLHHARPDGGRGFCVFNDVAVAIEVLREEGFAGPVLVVDLDLHDGDGTRLAFRRDPSVFTFSIHNRFWDDTPAEADLSLELAGEVEDEEYLGAVRAHVPELFARVAPELVFFNAGADPAHDDRLGNWLISRQGMFERDRAVLDLCAKHDVPTVMVLGGGYGGHAWRYTARTLAWVLAGWEDAKLPSNAEVTLSHYRRIFDFDAIARTTAARPGGIWDLSEEDVYGDLGAAPSRSRLLDFFTPHAIELILERAGLFERLRAAGYPRPTLALDLDGPGGQTLQVFTDPERSRRLIEIRMRRNRVAMPEFELLDLEWLLLQNPHAAFTPHRPRLPGQNHPGLGLLTEVMALVVLLCEQLHLDGVTFVPSHYHLAAQGSKYLRFVEPEDRAFFETLRRAAGDLPLSDATRAAERGELRDPDGRALRYRPMRMVLPVSRRLREKMAHSRPNHSSGPRVRSGQ